MLESRPQKRLRTYLIAFFVPLTGLPLIALSVLTYFLVGNAVNRELERRSVPELAAVSKNIDTLVRRLDKQLAEFARKDELKSALMEPTVLGDVIKPWTLNSNFEELRAYSADGNYLGEWRGKDTKRREDAWANFFGPRPLRPSEGEGRSKSQDRSRERDPAALSATQFAKSSYRFDTKNPKRLSAEFRKFLRSEDSWLLEETAVGAGNERSVWMTFFKIAVDADYRPAGFLEARLPIDEVQLKALSEYQGVDLALFSPEMSLLSASSPDVARKLSGGFGDLIEYAREAKLRGVSREVHIKGEPVEFFFTPLAPETGEPSAWIAVGLYKGDQVALRNQIIFWVAVMAALLAVLVVVLTVQISNLITKPVSDLVRAAEAVKMGEWVHPVEVDSSTEIGFLVRRFNEMAQSVQVTKRTLEVKLEELASAHTALTQTQGQLVQSAKMSSLGQLVAGVAHELNNPIAFIYSNMTQMKLHLKNVDRLDKVLADLRLKLPQAENAALAHELQDIEWDYVRKDMQDMTQSCLEGSIRVKDIVIGLRNFSRLDKGEIVEIDLNQALEDTAKLLSSQIRNRVELHWDFCQNAKLRCNSSQINQVLMNLLANAAQAIDSRGDIWVRTRIEKDEIGQEFLSLSIRDTGKGIKGENMDRIFDPFFTTKKVGEGTGLGLSIVYGIVERHRGEIQVKSIPAPAQGHGTEFVVRLPRQASQSGIGDGDGVDQAS